MRSMNRPLANQFETLTHDPMLGALRNPLGGARNARQVPASGPVKLRVSTMVYLRAAQAYILISMPTGTSTIFGAFQAILALLQKRDKLPPCS